jgi:hypothetical protein
MKSVLDSCGVPRQQAQLVNLVEGPPWIIVLTTAQVENRTLTDCLTAEIRAKHLEKTIDWVRPAPGEPKGAQKGNS